jgi:hypothetical protein
MIKMLKSKSSRSGFLYDPMIIRIGARYSHYYVLFQVETDLDFLLDYMLEVSIKQFTPP